MNGCLFYTEALKDEAFTRRHGAAFLQGCSAQHRRGGAPDAIPAHHAKWKNRLVFVSHIIAIAIYGFIIFLTVSPLHYEPGSPAYLAHGVTLTLSVYLALFGFIIAVHLIINTIRRIEMSRIPYNSSILTLVFMVILIIGKIFSLFN